LTTSSHESLSFSARLLERLRELGSTGRWQEVKLRLISVRHELAGHPWGLVLLAEAYTRCNEPRLALVAAEEALSIFRASADAEGMRKALNESGIAQFELGELDRAEDRFREVMALAEATGAEVMQAKAANNLGAICTLRGDRQLGLEYHRIALACFRKLADVRGEAETLHNLGICYRDLGLRAEAEAFFSQACARARDAGDETLVGFAIAARAEISLDESDLRKAEGASRQAMMRFDTAATPYGQAEALKLAGMIAVQRGDIRGGLERLDRALALSVVHGAPLLDAEIRMERGAVLHRAGRTREGLEELTAAARALERLGAHGLAQRARELTSRPAGIADSIL
jgi:tetratricopeptide (TPR) repeat protein